MSDTQPDVNQAAAPSPVAPAPVAPAADAPQVEKPPKGYVPYEALFEERQARKELEEKLEKLSAPPTDSGEIYSDEGKALKGEISSLNEKLRTIEKREQRREAEVEFPFLKDKRQEFDVFLEDEENKRLSVKKAAKLFAAELGFLGDNEPARVGLEKPTGGGQTIPEPTYSAEDVRDMMKNDWRRYERLIREGKI